MHVDLDQSAARSCSVDLLGQSLAPLPQVSGTGKAA